MRRAICSSFVAVTFTVSGASVESAELSVFTSGEFALTFNKTYFDKVEVQVIPKATGPASPSGATGPKRRVLALHHRPRSAFHAEGRYYFPSTSVIYVTPLFDKSVKDFAAAYPSLHANFVALQKILLLSRPQFYSQVDRRSNDRESRAPTEWTPFSKPRTREEAAKDHGPLTLPDEPFSNAGACLLAHYKRLTQPSGTGYRVLTYYRNASAGYGATNAELLYQYQGLTADEKFFITAKIAVRHDKLPDSIDDPRADSDETEAEQQAERRRINRWKEGSFFPPLPALDEMIGSIQINL